MPKIPARRSFLASAMSLAAGAFAACRLESASAADTAKAAAGSVTLETLENHLGALKLKPTKTESRFDFEFAHKSKEGEEWELSMSVVLSNDTKTVWMMAWLDELPQNAADVPRTALLRLLADNDKMGQGHFFAYVSSNRRFVLQKVIKNENISPASMKTDLLELGKTVIGTHPHWNVANWKSLGNTAPASPGAPVEEKPAKAATKASPATRK